MPCIKWDNEDCKYELQLTDLVLVTGACPYENTADYCT